MTNKEKFLTLVSEKDTHILEEIQERIKNREMLREAQQIAIKVLMKLDKIGWSKEDLSQKMNMPLKEIDKITSGKERLSAETKLKLQTILNIPILVSDNAPQKPKISFHEQDKLNVNELDLLQV